MADFDWDKDSTPAPASFDWGAESQPPAPTGVDAFLRGGRQGASLGFADENEALKAVALGTASDLVDAFERGDFVDTLKAAPRKAVEGYRAIRDLERGADKRAREANPGAFVAGELVGGAPAMLLPGGMSRQGLALAAGAGATTGYGASEEESPIRAGADALTGAALGLGGQALGDAAGRAFPRLAQKAQEGLGDFAAMRALNAAGYFKNELKPIIKRGGVERAVTMGEHLLDEPGVIQAGRNVESVLEGVEGAREKWGAEVGRLLQEADSTGAVFDMSRVARRVIDEVIQPNLGDPAIEKEVNAVGGLLRKYLTKAQQEGGLSFAEANKLKSTLANTQINWGNHWNNFGPSHHLEKYQKALAGIFTDEIDTQLGQQLGSEAFSAFKNAKARAGTFIDATDKAKNLNAAVQGNDQFRVKDLAAGALAGGGPMGFLATIGSKLGRERGASALARGADRLASSSSLDAIAKANPEAFGKYAGAVTSALARGPEALRALDKVLSDTSEEWRTMREQQKQPR